MDISQESKVQRDFSGGLQEFTSPYLSNPNECRMPSKNFDISTPGKLKRGPGMTEVGTAAAAITKGLFVFDKEDGTHTPFRLNTTNLQYLNGSTWTNVTSGTSFANNSTDIAYGVTTYTDNVERLYIVTGHNDYFGFVAGTIWTSNPGTENLKAKHIAYYKGRIYLGNVVDGATTYSSRFTWSGIGNDIFPANNYSDDMGSPITGLKVFGDFLYIFTESKVAKWDGVSLTPVPSTFGTTYGRSIVECDGNLYWYNKTGIIKYSGYGAPQLISRKIQPILESIGSSTQISAGVDKNYRIYFWIGNITYQSVSYTDVVLRYDSLINAWDLQDLLPMNVQISCITSGVLELYGADLGVGMIDNSDLRMGSNIDFKYTTAWLFTENSWDEKNFYSERITTEKADSGDSQTVTVSYRLNGEGSFTLTGNTFITNESVEFKMTEVDIPGQVKDRMIQIQYNKASALPLSIIERRLMYGAEQSTHN
jgi:hypothetical protein